MLDSLFIPLMSICLTLLLSVCLSECLSTSCKLMKKVSGIQIIITSLSFLMSAAAVCMDQVTAAGRRLTGEAAVETGRGTEEEEEGTETETEGGIGGLIEEKGGGHDRETDDRFLPSTCSAQQFSLRRFTYQDSSKQIRSYSHFQYLHL